MNAIETKNLTKFYGKNRGICDVGLMVPQGDFFGFIGPNGAGKSTTIRTLLGLIAPTKGQASVLGLDCVTQTKQVLARVGYLPSETVLYRGMRVKEILSLSADLRKVDCKGEAARLCERLNLDPNAKADELSFGNRKKVGIVCALQHKPQLYILDEPTSGLDPLMQREFYAILQERNQEGATVFLSSHVLSEVGRYCRHAGVIREGKLLACDSVENLVHSGVKRVTLRGAVLRGDLAHVHNAVTENDTIRFLYDGNPKELIAMLSGSSFEDVTITDPELDEVFMHYYAKEAE